MSTKKLSRDQLGWIVRAVWVKWAREQPAPKPHWLVPWNELDETSKEVDRQIGEAIAEFLGYENLMDENDKHLATIERMAAENDRLRRLIAAISEADAGERRG